MPQVITIITFCIYDYSLYVHEVMQLCLFATIGVFILCFPEASYLFPFVECNQQHKSLKCENDD